MSSKPWKDYPEIWKTKSAFMSFVRGGIRRGLWERNPIKLQFLKNNRKRVPLGRVTVKNPEGMVWGCECSICKRDFKQPECQVDHRNGNNPLRSMSDLLSFVKSMIMITDKDLAIVCKPCHTIKSYSERFGITFQEARLEKEGIRFKKLDKDIQIRFLIDNGFKDKDISNAAKRRSCFIKFNKGKEDIIMPKEME